MSNHDYTSQRGYPRLSKNPSFCPSLLRCSHPIRAQKRKEKDSSSWLAFARRKWSLIDRMGGRKKPRLILAKACCMQAYTSVMYFKYGTINTVGQNHNFCCFWYCLRSTLSAPRRSGLALKKKTAKVALQERYSIEKSFCLRFSSADSMVQLA